MTVDIAQPHDPPIYLQAKKRLLTEIGKRWKPGTRLPTVQQLAARYDVGRVSMHRAVRELADEGHLIARPRAGIQVADQSPAKTKVSARPLAIAGRTVDIISVSRERLEGMHRRMIDGITSRLCHVDCEVRHRDLLSEGRTQSFTDHEADALIFINAGKARLSAADHHAVVNIETGLINQFDPDRIIDHVTVNQLHGAALAGYALRLAGESSVCFLGAHSQRDPVTEALPYDQLSTMRLQGLESGFGRPVQPTHQLMTNFYDESAGASLVSEYLALDDRPHAIFATTDELAVGFVHGALAHDLMPGRDYRIVGFDGQQRGQEMRWGPLASVEVPANEMGCKAAELLIERFQRPDRPSQTVSLGCTLISGATLRPAASNDKGE